MLPEQQLQLRPGLLGPHAEVAQEHLELRLRAPMVVAPAELVGVALQVVIGHAVVGPHDVGLEVGYDVVRVGEAGVLVGGAEGPLVQAFPLLQAARRAGPAVGADVGGLADVPLCELLVAGAGAVQGCAYRQPPMVRARRGDDERGLVGPPAAQAAAAADVGVIELQRPGKLVEGTPTPPSCPARAAASSTRTPTSPAARGTSTTPTPRACRWRPGRWPRTTSAAGYASGTSPRPSSPPPGRSTSGTGSCDGRAAAMGRARSTWGASSRSPS